MARTQAQLYQLIRRLAPSWLWAELADAEPHMQAWAKMLARIEADLEAHMTATTFAGATGNDLGLHMIDHGLIRATGETEPHQRTRIAAQLKVRAVTRPGILALLSDILTGVVFIKTQGRDCVFYSRRSFLNRRFYVWDDKTTLGFVVYCETQADPNAYISAWRALDAARGGCIPARLEVLS